LSLGELTSSNVARLFLPLTPRAPASLVRTIATTEKFFADAKAEVEWILQWIEFPRVRAFNTVFVLLVSCGLLASPTIISVVDSVSVYFESA